jgi:hypothetical protein
MRKRWEGQMHPVTKPIIITSYGLAVIWVLWVTLVAFIGGTLPLLGWEVKGGIIWGLLSIACLWPIASLLFLLAYRALDGFAWWLNDRLMILFHPSNKSADASLPSNADVDRIIQQSMPMIQNTANDLMEMTRDALAKGMPPDDVVNILINKLGFEKNTAQVVVSNMIRKISKDTHTEKPVDNSGEQLHSQK